MGQNSDGFRHSINIKPRTGGDLSDTGDIGVDAADSNSLVFNNGSGAQPVLLQDDLTTHESDTTTHGATGAVVGTTNTQTLTNKTLTAPIISTISNTGTLTLPTSTDTLVGRATTDTLTNKTLTSPAITTPTGIVKGDVGLGNVDNTSDATKNSATATLTNKTLTTPIINTPTIIEYILADDTANFTILGGATNRSINIQTQGTGDINLTSGGEISLNGIEINNSNQVIATASSDLEIRAKTGQNTKINAFTGFVLLQKDNIEQARIVSTGIQLASSKTLSSAGGGSIVMNTSGAMTMPNATDTVVGKATTDTLTNKTIAAGSNTITGLTNTNLSGSAGITIANGGTGAATKAAAFDALSPLTTSGDILYGGASGTGTRLAKGSDGQFLTLSSGIPAWGSASNLGVTSVKTSTYAILTTDDVVLVDGTSAFTATLPTAVGVAGKQYRIKRVDQTLANVVTLATTSSQTIDGATTRTLATQYEEWTVVSDGANWQVLAHTYPQVWTSYTPTFTAFGTATSVNFFWKRIGDAISVRGAFTSGTTTGAEARISYPSGLTSASSTKLSTGNMVVGKHNGNVSNASFFSAGTMIAEASVTYLTMGAETSTLNGVTKYNANQFVGNTQPVHLFATDIPIANWEG